MTTSGLLHLSAFLQSASRNILKYFVCWDCILTPLYLLLLSLLFFKQVFLKSVFVIILVGFRNWERQSMLSLPSCTRSPLCGIFYSIHSLHNTTLWKDLLLLSLISWEVSETIVPPSFTLCLVLPVRSLFSGYLCSLQHFPSPSTPIPNNYSYFMNPSLTNKWSSLVWCHTDL